MQKSAPYASTPIAISLLSTTGLKYRTYNCYECGRAFLDREDDRLFRVGVKDLPEEAHIGPDGAVETICGYCSQLYSVTIAYSVQSPRVGLPLYMQPQSIYLSIEPVKYFRDTHCGECGKAYFSLSDRIKLIVDSAAPQELTDISRPGAMEARCNWKGCKQRWFVRV